MDLVEFEKFSVVVQPDCLAQIVPRTKDGLGYFTFSGSDLKPTQLDIAVLSVEAKVLTIEPYYKNTEFGILKCIPVFQDFLDEYGGSCSELHQLKLVGKTKDVFTRFISAKFKAEMVKASKNAESFDPQSVYPFGVSLVMVPEISSDKRRFFSCQCFDLDITDKFKSVDTKYLLAKASHLDLVY